MRISDWSSDVCSSELWTYEGEINKKFGPWGSTKLIFIYRDVEDRADVIRIGESGEAVGNSAKAPAGAIAWTSTITLHPAGVKGVRLNTPWLDRKSCV